ncbi:aryl-alcohol dehydrogenase-like predicted oxidoreductase [Halanaerobium saccharolyticum]|uniref:Aryl-alcohol dehydrogenase-like predicted oxidoreductase n=1 Tax=Halanaerobium saccharolyticum TaxID=43595 RepID=A0A4R6LBS9_9FIRM|nr:aldo/keto reductase [Halanaerobium saccharolyticum]TDO73363.1 aryl-alcohol dehydrogenase-like predicted oxidoreductase [Halanaerobium saccharolyticum]
MKYRKLGKTNLNVSEISFGGIMLMDTPQTEADQIVKNAVKNGINFFDVGPTYGNAQNILGPALKPYRDKVYLANKTEPGQSKDQVRQDMEKSLELLDTDYFDLYQLHEVTDEDALNKALGSGGALEAIIEAREEGLVKNIGFSAHKEWAALKLIESFDFDTVMFPINWNYWFNYDQGPEVIKKARENEMGIIAIKAMAQRRWEDGRKENYNTWYKPIYDNNELAELALKFTLSQDVDTAVSPGDNRMLDLAVEFYKKNEEEMEINDKELDKLKSFLESHGGKLYPIPK